MLVLSRKTQDSVIIDGRIEIIVLGVDGDTVKLGINAPRDVNILRKELYEAIQLSNHEATNKGDSLKLLSELVKTKGKE